MILPVSFLDDVLPDRIDVEYLHLGENNTSRVKLRNGDQLIVKHLLRTSRLQAESEIAWLAALAASGYPSVKPWRPEHHLLDRADGLFLLLNYIEGRHPADDDPEAYRLAGRLLSELHRKADSIAAAADASWPGNHRLRYDRECVLARSIRAMTASPLFAGMDIRLARIADWIAFHLDEAQGFIHGDFHFGNLLTDGIQCTVIDFDECGFGSRFYDVGTMGLYARALQYAEGWHAFLDGYGFDANDVRVRAGMAARIFYLLGKLPSRLDIPDLHERAPSIARDYIYYIDECMAGT